MYTLQNLVTDEYARYTTGGLKTFMHYRTVRAYRDTLNLQSRFNIWTVRREQA